MRLPRAVSAVLLLACLLGAPGCAWMGKYWRKKQPPAATLAWRQVGTVSLVNDDDRFVLIDGGFLQTPLAGTELKSFTGETESALLTVSAVRRRPFVIADILRGQPRKGDRVVAGN